MASVHATHGVDRYSLSRRSSSALLCLAISCMLTACGGSAEPAASGVGGSGVVTGCATGANTATLTWDAVSDPDLAGYRVYYGTAPGMYGQARGAGDPVAANATTHTVPGLASGTYFFAITAYGVMQFESDFSNEVCKTIS